MSATSVAARRLAAGALIGLGMLAAPSADQGATRDLPALLHQYRFADPDPAVAEFARWD
jgi:hypothetical protein